MQADNGDETTRTKKMTEDKMGECCGQTFGLERKTMEDDGHYGYPR